MGRSGLFPQIGKVSHILLGSALRLGTPLIASTTKVCLRILWFMCPNR